MAQIRRAANYGYTVDRMRALDAMDGVRRPIWNFVEVGWPYTETAAQGARAIPPAEVRAAVWHSIIAGARGIIYFNHSFGGPNPSQHVPARSALCGRARGRKEHEPTHHTTCASAQRTIRGRLCHRRSIRPDMAKFHQDRYFVFAGSKENRASTPTFSLTGVDSGTATVIGENRTIPISNGRFSDSFADGNAIHIYRIDSQSTGERP